MLGVFEVLALTGLLVALIGFVRLVVRPPTNPPRDNF